MLLFLSYFANLVAQKNICFHEIFIWFDLQLLNFIHIYLHQRAKMAVRFIHAQLLPTWPFSFMNQLCWNFSARDPLSKSSKQKIPMAIYYSSCFRTMYSKTKKRALMYKKMRTKTIFILEKKKPFCLRTNQNLATTKKTFWMDAWSVLAKFDHTIELLGQRFS